MGVRLRAPAGTQQLSDPRGPVRLPPQMTESGSRLQQYPPAERWDDWVEWDPKLWPRRVPRHYQLIPTVCFNCESACGLLGGVDKETLEGPLELANLQRLLVHPAHQAAGRLAVEADGRDQLVVPRHAAGPLPRIPLHPVVPGLDRRILLQPRAGLGHLRRKADGTARVAQLFGTCWGAKTNAHS